MKPEGFHYLQTASGNSYQKCLYLLKMQGKTGICSET